jgi:hypothetical protein
MRTEFAQNKQNLRAEMRKVSRRILIFLAQNSRSPRQTFVARRTDMRLRQVRLRSLPAGDG